MPSPDYEAAKARLLSKSADDLAVIQVADAALAQVAALQAEIETDAAAISALRTEVEALKSAAGHEPDEEPGDPSQAEPDSADGFTVARGGQAIALAGHRYRIGEDGRIYRDEAVQLWSGGVDLMFVLGGKIYQHAGGDWGSAFFEAKEGAAPIADPRPAPGGDPGPTPPVTDPTLGLPAVPDNPVYFRVEFQPVDPSSEFAYAWIRASGSLFNTVAFDVDARDGHQTTESWVEMRPGEASERQIAIQLGPDRTKPFTFHVHGYAAPKVGAQNNWDTDIQVQIGFRAGAPAQSRVPYVKRPDVPLAYGETVWASKPDWSNFKAKDGGGFEVFDTLMAWGGIHNNNEPVTYTDQDRDPGAETWFIEGGDLVQAIRNLGHPVGERPFIGSMLRANWIKGMSQFVWEWVTKNPSGPGAWTGLWGLATNDSWEQGPEPDIEEAYPGNGKDYNAMVEISVHERNKPSITYEAHFDKIFGRADIDLTADYYQRTYVVREDWSLTYLTLPDGTRKEVFCAPTRNRANNGSSDMYPLMDLTLQNGWAGRIPTGRQPAYQMRHRAFRVFEAA